MIRGFWKAETGLFLGVWLFLMIAGQSRFFRDPGTFWHTVAGERMLTTHRVIRVDPFSFTFGGRPWVAYEWLGECVMAALHRLGGLDSLLLATATLLAGLYTWTAHRLIRTGLHWLPATFVVTLTLSASATHFHVRPHLVTIVFLGFLYAGLCDFENHRIGLGRLFWFIPLFVIWSNVHGGALGGLATLGLVAAGWGLAGALGLPAPIARSRQALLLGVLVVACGLTTLVNPYGVRLPGVWLALMRSPLLPRIIQEHARLDLLSPEGGLIALLALGYATILASAWPVRPRVTWLVPLAWFVLTLDRVRHAPLFGITAVVALADILPHSRLAGWLARPGRDWFQPRSRAERAGRAPGCRAAVIPIGVIAAAAGLECGRVHIPVLGSSWAQLDRSHWPVDLLPELRACEPSAPATARIFNDYLYGGFLIYHTPGLPVFIDDRCEVYGDEFLRKFFEVRSRDPLQIESFYKQYGFRFALVPSGSSLDRYLERAPNWAVIRRTDVAALYQRSDSR
jgi:hypothetical protein